MGKCKYSEIQKIKIFSNWKNICNIIKLVKLKFSEIGKILIFWNKKEYKYPWVSKIISQLWLRQLRLDDHDHDYQY